MKEIQISVPSPAHRSRAFFFRKKKDGGYKTSPEPVVEQQARTSDKGQGCTSDIDEENEDGDKPQREAARTSQMCQVHDVQTVSGKN